MAEVYNIFNGRKLKRVDGITLADQYVALGWDIVCSGYKQDENIFVFCMGWSRPGDPKYPSDENDF
ncbi:MAG TPA: hypothetical protein DDZ91_04315 [Firmicutes bacterium]|nr:hypothetical protein [Bacillota bacterium]